PPLANNGTYDFKTTLPAGTYTVSVIGSKFSAESKTGVVVEPGKETKDVNITLSAPATISGRAYNKSDNTAVSGVTIEVLKGDTVVATATTGPAQKVGTYEYNYKIELPIGTYTVRATKSGYKSNPVSNVAVKLGEETKNADFPLEPLFTFPRGMALVSAPYEYGSTKAGDLFNIPFRLATWNGDRYVMYPNAPADTFHLGRGYFMKAEDAEKRLSLTVQGTPADTTKPYLLEIRTGWNMIGDPFTFAVNWTGVRVRDETGEYSLQEAAAKNIVSNILWRFIAGQYEMAFTMQPWQGYWVRAFKNATLVIPNTTTSAAPAAAQSRSANTSGNWKVKIVASSGEAVDGSNYIGVSPGAADGFDAAHDAEKPPVLPEMNALNLSFPHTDWQAAPGGYAGDVRSAGSKTQVWEFTVENASAGQPVTISWPDMQRVPKNVRLTLIDVDANRQQTMRTTSGYTFRMAQGAASRRFRIESSDARSGTLMITGVAATPLRAGTGSTISFSLSQEASVEVSVYTLTGKKLRSVARPSGRAGGNQVVWDGKDQQGRAVPAGSYLFEVRAIGPTGETVKAVNMLPVPR
ncbi:MAG: hypothetical protein IT210_03295, partial [Armatimonadetes bacterium]|nr:hypothetical protein [Armatimonadota bacterium]